MGDFEIELVIVLTIAMVMALSIVIATSSYFLNVVPVFNAYAWIAFLAIVFFGIISVAVGYKMFN